MGYITSEATSGSAQKREQEEQIEGEWGEGQREGVGDFDRAIGQQLLGA